MHLYLRAYVAWTLADYDIIANMIVIILRTSAIWAQGDAFRLTLKISVAAVVRSLSGWGTAGIPFPTSTLPVFKLLILSQQ